MFCNVEHGSPSLGEKLHEVDDNTPVVHQNTGGAGLLDVTIRPRLYSSILYRNQDWALYRTYCRTTLGLLSNFLTFLQLPKKSSV